MKTIFAFLLLIASAQAQLLVVGKQAVSTPAVIQSAGCTAASATTCAGSFGSAVGAGHYLVFYEGSTGNSTGVAIAMTGETIPRVAGASNNTGAEGDAFISTNTVGGQTSFTCTFSTTLNQNCIGIEVSSPVGAHATDRTGNAQSTTTAISVATSLATTVANDLCLGLVHTTQSGGTLTPGGSWHLEKTQGNGVNSGTTYVESLLATSTGIQTATGTLNAGSNNPEGIACLKP